MALCDIIVQYCCALVFCSFFSSVALVFPVAAVACAAAVPAAFHALVVFVGGLVVGVRGV